VSGVNYRTESTSGLTGPNGEFLYNPGETVTFFIGDVIIGSALATSQVTPIALSPSLNDKNPVTLNIARFLQSLDSDGNLNNGIQITSAMSGELSGKNIDFSVSTSTFNDQNMQALFASLNSKGVFTDGKQRNLIGDLEAQYNLSRTLNPSVQPFDGGWTANIQYPDTTSGSGITISSGNIDLTTPVVSGAALGQTARITIAGSAVTFVPVSGATVTGSMSPVGNITIPDRTIECLDVFGNKLTLPSTLILNSDGTISGEWSIGLPLPNGGYSYPYKLKATFYADVHLGGEIIILPQNVSNPSQTLTLGTVQ
jgi:hypothetical protein